MATPDGRNVFLDVCKGIGILCVYYGHTALWGTMPSKMIFSFHMPLFFLFICILFSVCSFRNALAKTWNNLLLPYLLFVVVGQLIKIDQTFAAWSTHPLLCFLRIVHGEGSNAIWFLICLADLQIVMAMIFRNVCSLSTGEKALGILTLALIADLVFRTVPSHFIPHFPVMLASVPSGGVFFLTGVCFKDFFLYATKNNLSLRTAILWLLPVFTVFVTLAISVKGTIDIRRAMFSLKVFPVCLAGLACVYVVASLSMHISPVRSLLSALGRRSLPLFAMELPLGYVLAKVTNDYFPKEFFTTPHVGYIEPIRIFTILALAWFSSWPLMWALDKIRRIANVQP